MKVCAWAIAAGPAMVASTYTQGQNTLAELSVCTKDTAGQLDARFAYSEPAAADATWSLEVDDRLLATSYLVAESFVGTVQHRLATGR